MKIPRAKSTIPTDVSYEDEFDFVDYEEVDRIKRLVSKHVDLSDIEDEDTQDS